MTTSTSLVGLLVPPPIPIEPPTPRPMPPSPPLPLPEETAAAPPVPPVPVSPPEPVVLVPLSLDALHAGAARSADARRATQRATARDRTRPEGESARRGEGRATKECFMVCSTAIAGGRRRWVVSAPGRLRPMISGTCEARAATTGGSRAKSPARDRG